MVLCIERLIAIASQQDARRSRLMGLIATELREYFRTSNALSCNGVPTASAMN